MAKTLAYAPEIGQSRATRNKLRIALSIVLIAYTLSSWYIAMKAEPFFVYTMNSTLVYVLLIAIPSLIIALLILAVILCAIIAKRGSGGGL